MPPKPLMTTLHFAPGEVSRPPSPPPPNIPKNPALEPSLYRCEHLRLRGSCVPEMSKDERCLIITSPPSPPPPPPFPPPPPPCQNI